MDFSPSSTIDWEILSKSCSSLPPRPQFVHLHTGSWVYLELMLQLSTPCNLVFVHLPFMQILEVGERGAGEPQLSWNNCQPRFPSSPWSVSLCLLPCCTRRRTQGPGKGPVISPPGPSRGTQGCAVLHCQGRHPYPQPLASQAGLLRPSFSAGEEERNLLRAQEPALLLACPSLSGAAFSGS